MAETVLEEKSGAGNPMREIRVEKVVVNICPGKPGEPLEKAKQVLKLVTGVTPVERRAGKTVKEFGVRRREAIAAIVTLRGEKAEEFLAKALKAVGNRIKRQSIRNSVFSFGVKEHIQFPGVKYDPKIGVLGMDVCIRLCRPGYRVMYRKRRSSSIGKAHRITGEEAINFMRKRFGLEVV